MINGGYLFTEEDVARIDGFFAGREPWQRNADDEVGKKEGEAK